MSDTIKREDAIKIVKSMKYRLTNGSTFEFLLQKFSEIPSADRPQGKWIMDRYWSRGYDLGYNEGSDESCCYAFSRGKEEGYRKGHEDGYNEGVMDLVEVDGYEEARDGEILREEE